MVAPTNGAPEMAKIKNKIPNRQRMAVGSS
jgi:hypothetical protein